MLMDETTTAESRQEVANNLVKLFLGQGLVKEFLDVLFKLELEKTSKQIKTFLSWIQTDEKSFLSLSCHFLLLLFSWTQHFVPKQFISFQVDGVIFEGKYICMWFV